MPICPMDLERCDRPECAGKYCGKVDEFALEPCVGCGYLIVMRRGGFCVECITVATTNEPET
ncbi:MAG: hypothetical protein JWN94_3 [Betaproteobacteria bacterium]|nr:hypothetical protein [Betaproteobacteria bacterium]